VGKTVRVRAIPLWLPFIINETGQAFASLGIAVTICVTGQAR